VTITGSTTLSLTGTSGGTTASGTASITIN
jgi:hypothetical protein